MQGDGNFVVYDASNTPLWNSVTAGHPGATLKFRGEDVVVVDAGGSTLWSAR